MVTLSDASMGMMKYLFDQMIEYCIPIVTEDGACCDIQWSTNDITLFIGSYK